MCSPVTGKSTSLPVPPRSRRVKWLTFAFVGVAGIGPAPRPIEVERLAALAVPAGRVVLAVAAHLPVRPGRDAAERVPVALAPAADGKVGHGVMVVRRLPGPPSGVVEPACSGQSVAKSAGRSRGCRRNAALPGTWAELCSRYQGSSNVSSGGIWCRWNTIRTSVAVTQSCSTGDESKSGADGRPSSVLNAMRDTVGASARPCRCASVHRASCSFARVIVARFGRPYTRRHWLL
uniref:Uncharacterized protein n=1 Tax=Anopheles melas TaxID=34690 RepID=A0A182TVF3_9DIPT